MPRPPSRKKRAPVSPEKSVSVPASLDPLRTGMPAQDSIIGVKEYKKRGQVFRIIKTTEQDAYDKPEPVPPKQKRKR